MSFFKFTIVDTKCVCPKCKYEHSEDDYYNKLCNSRLMQIYIKCKGCKSKLGITTNIKGSVEVWLKEDEKKQVDTFLAKSKEVKP